MQARTDDHELEGRAPRRSAILVLLAMCAGACAADVSGETAGDDQRALTDEELREEGVIAVSKAALTPADFTNFKGVSAQEIRSDAFVLNDTTDRVGFGVLLPPIGGYANNSTQLPNVQLYFFPNASGAIALTSDIENAVAPVRSRLDAIPGAIENAVGPVRNTADQANQRITDVDNRLQGVNTGLVGVNNEVIRLRADVNNLIARLNSIPPPPATSCTANDGATTNGGFCAFQQCGSNCTEAGRGDCSVSVNGNTCTARTRLFGPTAMPCGGICCLCR